MSTPSGDIVHGPYQIHTSEKTLGKGSFGEVYKATCMKDKKTIAVKKINYLSLDVTVSSNKFMVDMAKKEIKGAMALNGHPNAIMYLDHFDDGMSFWLAMEYCELGDLENYLTYHQKNPDLETKLDLMLQCARGIAFMHSFYPPMVHRDIKLKNFLVTKQGGKDVVKVTDFGVAKFIEDKFGKTGAGSAFLSSFVGTPPFMAPEFFETDKEIQYKASVDIFSLGLVFLVLLQYPEKLKDFIPKPADSYKHISTMSLGMTICHAAKSGLPIPQIVIIEPSDNDTVKAVKTLIKDMTHHQGNKRKELWLVEQELEEITLGGGTMESTDDMQCEAISKVDDTSSKNGMAKLELEENPLTESKVIGMVERDKVEDDHVDDMYRFSHVIHLDKEKESELVVGTDRKDKPPLSVWQSIPLKPAVTEVTEDSATSGVKESIRPPKPVSGSSPTLESNVITTHVEKDTEVSPKPKDPDISWIMDQVKKQIEASNPHLTTNLNKDGKKLNNPSDQSRSSSYEPDTEETYRKAFLMTKYPEPVKSLKDRKLVFEGAAAGGKKMNNPSDPDTDEAYKKAFLMTKYPEPVKPLKDRKLTAADTRPSKPVKKVGDSSDDEPNMDDTYRKAFLMTKYSEPVKSMKHRMQAFEAAVAENQTPVKPRKSNLDDYDKKTDLYDVDDEELRKQFAVSNIKNFTPLKDKKLKLYDKKENV